MAAKAKILVVDDEADLLELVGYNLAQAGYAVETAANGEDGLGRAKIIHPDLIILDLMLPGMDGLELCKLLKADPATGSIPVIMLTAKSEESDLVVGLELGADDYMTKPFSLRVLLARVKAMLRRKSGPAGAERVLHIHSLAIDPGRRRVWSEGKELELTFTEFQILHLLAQRPGWVFARDRIIDAVKGEDYAVTERSVDVQIAGLRKKLGPAGKFIETVRGAGYRLKE